jgi:hypothetical protein
MTPILTSLPLIAIASTAVVGMLTAFPLLELVVGAWREWWTR